MLTSACSPNTSKIIGKGYSKLNSGNYDKAIKKFDKAVRKPGYGKAKAYHGLALSYENKNNISRALNYAQRACKTNTTDPGYSFNLARYNAYLGEESKAINWLFNIGDAIAVSRSRNIEYYARKASNDPFLKTLRNDIKFRRFLDGGYRRVKLSIRSGKSSVDDKWTQNDQFAVVSAQTNNGKQKVILATDVIQDDNSASFYGEYVIFDYKLGTTISIGHYDEDYTSHDRLSSYKGPIPSNLQNLTKTTNSRSSSLSFSISDANTSTYTSGTDIPSTISTSDILLGVGAAALVIGASELSS